MDGRVRGRADARKHVAGATKRRKRCMRGVIRIPTPRGGMPWVALRAMVRSVVAGTFSLYRRLAVRAGLAAALVFAPLAVALLALELAVGQSTQTQQGIAIIDAVGSVLLFAPLAAIIAIRCAIALDEGRTAEPRREAAAAFQLLPRYVLTQLLALVVIAGLPLLLIGAGIATGSQALTAIGAGTLLASGVINGVRLGLATVLVVTGDGAYAQALRASARLVRGSFWGSLGTIVAITLIALVLALLLSTVAIAAPAGAGRAVIEAVVGVAVNAVTVPFAAVGLYRLVGALRERDRERGPVSGA
jgi:hypothetical protein